MLLGYNHNIPYNGLVFHIQTEDSGTKKPHITTLLYREGVILCSQKTSYADILTIENIEEIVEDLMKEQHKNMLRRLKSGEFDHKISAPPQPKPPQDGTVSAEETPCSISISAEPTTTNAAETKQSSISPPKTALNTQSSSPNAVPENTDLDAIIRSFFGIGS